MIPRTLQDMHTIIFRIIVEISDPARLEWVLERKHILPVEPRFGMEVRDHDKTFIFRIPADLILEKVNGEWIWVSETKVSKTASTLEEYFSVMNKVHHYELVSLPKVTWVCAEQLEKELHRVSRGRVEVIPDSSIASSNKQAHGKTAAKVQNGSDKMVQHPNQ